MTTTAPLPIPASAEEDARIEGLRGIAALMVLVSHYAGYWTATLGWLGFATTGVDLFFVLSGFVFAPYVLSHKRLAWWPHVVRRFFRLYPLYIVALLIYAFLKQGENGVWTELLRHLAMAHTLGGIDRAFFFNPAFWSLPPEVEFYLFMPAIAWLVHRVGVWRLFWMAVALRLALVAPGTPGVMEITPMSISTVHLPGLLVEFMVGVVVYELAFRARSVDSLGMSGAGLPASRMSRYWLVGLAVAVLLGALGVYGVAIAPGPAQAATWPVLVTGNMGAIAAFAYGGVLLVVCACPDRMSSRVRQAAIQLGRLSYGIYLFHNAAPQLVTKVIPSLSGNGPWLSLVSLGCTLALAWLANRWVEEPARAWGRSLSVRLAKHP